MSDFTDCMVDTITVAGPLDIELSPGGTETVVNTTTQAAYIENIKRIGVTGDGTSENADTLIITDDVITYDSRIWMPGEDPSTSPGRTPVRVDVLPDIEAGPGVVSHYEVEL